MEATIYKGIISVPDEANEGIPIETFGRVKSVIFLLRRVVIYLVIISKCMRRFLLHNFLNESPDIFQSQVSFSHGKKPISLVLGQNVPDLL